jgi:MoaA/NifB/PqqE/SkfB family radical SAM enzyme
MSYQNAYQCDDTLMNSIPVEFLWLELTDICNLKCKHCYANSGPENGNQDLLSEMDYKNIIHSAYSGGCRSIQFIGGEPTANNSLPYLIRYATALGFEFVEIFSNLVRFPECVFDVIVDSKDRSQIATSLYSYDPETHDRITGKPGSHLSTLKNIEKILAAEIPLRAAFIEMNENSGHFDRTLNFLQSIGVRNVQSDRVRNFGRGAHDEESIDELCGHCAGPTLCIGSDGAVSPCIMSRSWSIGNIRQSEYMDLVNSDSLKKLRSKIAKQHIETQKENNDVTEKCNPCNPWANCKPCPPNTHCNPHNCVPW